MCQVTMIGCDLHDRDILLQVAVGRAKPRKLAFYNDSKDRPVFIDSIAKANLFNDLPNGMIE